jgi:ketosteroid isomerase-like protein
MRLRTLLPVSLLAACLASGVAQAAEPDFKAHLQKVLDAWCSLDINQPAPYYTKDPSAVFFDVAPMKYTGWKEYADGFAKSFIPMAKSAKVTIGPDFRATKLGTHVLATYTALFAMEEMSGRKQDFHVRFTQILEKQGNNWIIVHEHVSSPMGN